MTAVVFVVLGAASTLLLYAFYRGEVNASRSVLEANESATVDLQKTLVEDAMHAAGGDTVYGGTDPHLDALADARGAERRRLLDETAAVYSRFLTAMQAYSAITILDVTGREVLALTYRNGVSRRVPQARLVSAADTSYFAGAMLLRPGHVYVSRFDLEGSAHASGGKSAVVHLSVPIHDRGARSGVLVLDYEGERITEMAARASMDSPGWTWVFDDHGQRLSAPGPTPAVGSAVIAQDSSTWRRLASSDSGHFAENGALYTFARMYPTMAAQVRPDMVTSREDARRLPPPQLLETTSRAARGWWLFVRLVPADRANDDTRRLRNVFLMILVAMLAICFVVAVLLVRALHNRRQGLRLLRSLALDDKLTGLRNRRGFDTLAGHALAHADRLGRVHTLLFVDLDGLKGINDRLGHEQGDAALVDFATALRRVFRQSDVTARLGGDEFAVLAMEEVDERSVRERLATAVEALHAEEERPFRLRYSIGFVTRRAGDPRSMDALLHDADAAMYEEKRRHRGEEDWRSGRR